VPRFYFHLLAQQNNSRDHGSPKERYANLYLFKILLGDHVTHPTRYALEPWCKKTLGAGRSIKLNKFCRKQTP